jgi:hypothetical protein
MTVDMLIGLLVTAVALCAVVSLTLWSRSIIERIHSHPPRSLREIKREIINGKDS